MIYKKYKKLVNEQLLVESMMMKIKMYHCYISSVPDKACSKNYKISIIAQRSFIMQFRSGTGRDKRRPGSMP